VRTAVLGEEARRGISLEDLPMGSVVYVGRGAFRMEAVGPDGLIADLDGVVQPVTGMVTAPYGHAPGERIGAARAPAVGAFRAPDLPPLFGSQTDVPVLAAPIGTLELPSPRAVTMPRAAFAALGAVVFACGLVIGGAALRPARAPASEVHAVQAVQPAPAPVAAAPATVEPAPEPDVPPRTTIALPEPVRIAIPRHVAARRAVVADKAAPPPPAKPWVDPFAD
jgi:hypothetical protein